MELCHQHALSQSPALQRLGQFVRAHRQPWTQGVPDLEPFERELHQHVLELERELLSEELARYDVTAAEIAIKGVTYHPTLTATETYLSTAGPVTVSRHLYRPAGRGSQSICPLEWRAGMIAGYFTPRAARQAAFVTAHLTPAESEALFDELESMRPTRDSPARGTRRRAPHPPCGGCDAGRVWSGCPKSCRRIGKVIGKPGKWRGARKKPCLQRRA